MPNSRLERLVESCRRERRFPGSSYWIRSPKDEPYKFIKDEPPNSFDKAVLLTFQPKSSPTPAEREWREIEEEIGAARYILHIKNDPELADFCPYTPTAFARATDFLRRLMIHAHTSNLIGIGVPQIGPADKGSIDLYWNKDDRTLLINFLSSEQVANFYGRKAKSEISGTFDPSEARPELAVWLID